MAPFQSNINSDDYYAVLGVARDASEKEIARAYKQLALMYHPDKNPENKSEAEDNFKKISQAYNILGDTEKRKEYDEFGKDGPRFTPGGNGRDGFCASQGFSSEQAQALFGELFSGAGLPSGGLGGSSFVFSSGAGMPFSFGSDAFPQFAPRSSMNQRHESYSTHTHAIPNGTSVVVRGLTRVPKHNGSVGLVRNLDLHRCRYAVSLGESGAGETISLKPTNITQLCGIEVVNLHNKPELNGCAGKLYNYDSATDRYMVLLERPPLAIALQRGNCLLKAGTRIVLQGLSRQEMNGQMGQIIGLDHAVERYTVECAGGKKVKVKYDNIVC